MRKQGANMCCNMNYVPIQQEQYALMGLGHSLRYYGYCLATELNTLKTTGSAIVPNLNELSSLLD